MNTSSSSSLSSLAVVVSLVSSLLGACAGSDEAHSATEPSADRGLPVVQVAPPDAAPAVDHPASGYLRHASGIIDPWCGAVLVAPNQVVTAAGCLDGEEASLFSFGLGAVNSGKLYEVTSGTVDPAQREGISSKPGLAVLTLREAVQGVTPVALAHGKVTGAVSTVSYEYTERRKTVGVRRSLTGQAVASSEGVGAYFQDAPNCHGESGSGLFAKQNGQEVLVGLGWGGTSEHADPTQPACFRTLTFLSVVDNAAFLQKALKAQLSDTK